MRTLGVDVIFLKDKPAPVPRGGVGHVAAHPVGQAGRRGRLDGKEGVTASLPDCIDIGKKNKAKCLLDAIETPLSLLHFHTLCLIGMHHVVKLELSRIF